MQYIEYSVQDHIGLLKVSREKALNALNSQVLQELEQVVDQVSLDRGLYCLVITGAGEKAFVAGADIVEMKDYNREQAYAFGQFGNRVFRKIEQLPMPTIAMVNGYALGGGFELALACDLRVASENASFGFPEAGIGIIPGYGGTQRLPRLIGVSAAKKLLFTSSRIKSDEALKLGVVDEVVPAPELQDKVFALAGLIARQAPIAVANLKKAVELGLSRPIDDALLVETDLFAKCFDTQDQKMAMAAFVSKEKIARFENK